MMFPWYTIILNTILIPVVVGIDSNRYEVINPGELLTGKLEEYPSIKNNILCSSR